MANLIPDLAPQPWFSSNCGSEVGKSRNQHHRVRGSQIFMVVSGPRGLVLLFYIRPRPRPSDFMTYAPKALWFCHTSKYALDQVGSKRFMRNMSQFTNMRPQNVRMYAECFEAKRWSKLIFDATKDKEWKMQCQNMRLVVGKMKWPIKRLRWTSRLSTLLFNAALQFLQWIIWFLCQKHNNILFSVSRWKFGQIFFKN